MLERSRAAAGLVLLAALSFPCALSAASGTVVYVEGDVSLTSGGETREASIGDAVAPGDAVVTGARSLAVIDLTNRTTVKLKEKTYLAIDTIGEVAAVTLTAGGVFTSIAGKLTGRFSVQTPNAVCGVRGTEFFVAYGRTIDARPDVWMCVNEGTVEVAVPATGQTVLVPRGLGVNILGAGRITAPRPYAWTRKLNWNVNPGAGGVQDTTSLDQAYSDLLDQDYD
ncbi:MAG TPA: FecR family protein [Spirochaetia bacterium]|nr:FecR family protein [Spirochaetia bacterium]